MCIRDRIQDQIFRNFWDTFTSMKISSIQVHGKREDVTLKDGADVIDTDKLLQERLKTKSSFQAVFIKHWLWKKVVPITTRIWILLQFDSNVADNFIPVISAMKNSRAIQPKGGPLLIFKWKPSYAESVKKSCRFGNTWSAFRNVSFAKPLSTQDAGIIGLSILKQNTPTERGNENFKVKTQRKNLEPN